MPAPSGKGFAHLFRDLFLSGADLHRRVGQQTPVCGSVRTRALVGDIEEEPLDGQCGPAAFCQPFELGTGHRVEIVLERCQEEGTLVGECCIEARAAYTCRPDDIINRSANRRSQNNAVAQRSRSSRS